MKFYSSSNITSEPIEKIDSWLIEAVNAGVPLPHAMNIATVDKYGFPSSRMVLLKTLTDQGLVFFTDYSSRKGKNIIDNGRASVNFWWARTNKAIRVEGLCSKVSEKESDEYFYSRPIESRISAYVSNQSEEIESYLSLENRVKEFKDDLKGSEVERPLKWGGFLIKPSRIEFWHDQPNRLHTRELFTVSTDGWKKTLLSP
tara:strand:- start:401 stop:1003 length:603 start_codon:yes stop_codon:yes gene_type:complete